MKNLKKLTYEQFVETLQPYEIEGGFGVTLEKGYKMYYLPNDHPLLNKKFNYKNKRKAYQEYLELVKDKMATGGGVGKIGVTYFIGRPEVDKIGRFNTRLAVWQTCVVEENGYKNYGQRSKKFSAGSANNLKLDGIKITKKEFDKLVFDKKLANGGWVDKKIIVETYKGKLEYNNQDIQEMIDNPNLSADNLPSWLYKTALAGNPDFPKNKKKVIEVLEKIKNSKNDVYINVSSKEPIYKHIIRYEKGGGVGFSPVAVEKANLEQLFDMAKELGLDNFQNLNKEVLREKILENFKLNRFRGKMATGGGVEAKAPRWWNKQVRPYMYFVFNTETNKVWAGNEYENDAKDELKEFLLDNPKLPLKVLTKRAITNKKINPLDYNSWARSSEQSSAITKQMSKGGRIDLFEDYENIPPKVQAILDRYSEDFGGDGSDMDYKDTANMLEEVEAVGYTFGYGLDNEPYGLRPIGVKLNELRDYEDFDDEEMATGGKVGKKVTTKVYANNEKATVDIFTYEFDSNTLSGIKKELKALQKEVAQDDLFISGEFRLNNKNYSFNHGDVEEIEAFAKGGGIDDLYKNFKYKDGSQVKRGDFIELPYSKYGFHPEQESITKKYEVIKVDDSNSYRTPRLIVACDGDIQNLTINMVANSMPFSNKKMAKGGGVDDFDSEYWLQYNESRTGRFPVEFLSKSTDFENTFKKAIEIWNKDAEGEENKIKAKEVPLIKNYAKKFFEKEKWISIAIIHVMIFQGVTEDNATTTTSNSNDEILDFEKVKPGMYATSVDDEPFEVVAKGYGYEYDSKLKKYDRNGIVKDIKDNPSTYGMLSADFDVTPWVVVNMENEGNPSIYTYDTDGMVVYENNLPAPLSFYDEEEEQEKSIENEISKRIMQDMFSDYQTEEEIADLIADNLGLIEGSIIFDNDYFEVKGVRTNGDRLEVSQRGEYTMFGGPYTPKMEQAQVLLNGENITKQVEKALADSIGTPNKPLDPNYIMLYRTDIWGYILDKISTSKATSTTTMATPTKNIAKGAAAIKVELSNGNITVYHSTSNEVLLSLKDVPDGSWDKLWDFLRNDLV